MKTTKALVKFDFDVAVITALDERYKDIQTAEGTKAHALVMKGLSEYCEIRLAIDKQHKKLKADILVAGRSLDGDKTRLKDLIQPGESRLRDLKNAEDDRKDAIKEEKEAKERERIQLIQDKISDIRSLGISVGRTSSEIENRLRLLMSTAISEEIYQEFKPQALEAQNTVVAELEKALADRIQFEKEEEERKAEAERLEAQRKEQEAAQAKIDKEKRKVELAKAEIEEKKATETRRIERAEWERKVKEKAEQDSKETLQRVEQERLEKEEAEAKEKTRKAAMAPDREKLIEFADRLDMIARPDVKSAKAKKILSDANDRLEKLSRDIDEQADKL